MLQKSTIKFKYGIFHLNKYGRNDMKNKNIVLLVIVLMFTTLFSTSVAAKSGPELEIKISDYFNNNNPLIRYSHGLQIQNVGDEAAVGIAVDFTVSGGIFLKLRQILKIRDIWQYGCGKIQPSEQTYCPICLNCLYLGRLELTATVWADNAEPVTQTVIAFASLGFIWIYSTY